METLLQTISRIVIVGVGGTGSFLLPPLIRYINSRNDVREKIQIMIVDGDKYDEGNVNRQEFAHSRIGKNKADVQTEIFQRKFPSLYIESVPSYLGKENIGAILCENSIVFVCVDNHFCRHIVSEHCQEIDNVLMICGGNEEYDGNVQAYFSHSGVHNNPVEIRHPEIARANDGDRSEMSCEELANLPGGGQVIFANLFSATLMCSLFFAYETNSERAKNIDDIFFDVRLPKTARVVNGIPE